MLLLSLPYQFTEERMQIFRQVTAEVVSTYCQNNSERCGEIFSRKKRLVERYWLIICLTFGIYCLLSLLSFTQASQDNTSK